MLYLEQFSSALAYHPEYALIFYESQHAGICSVPPFSSSGRMLQSLEVASSRERAGTEKNDHKAQQAGNAPGLNVFCDSPSVTCNRSLLRPRSKEATILNSYVYAYH